MNVKNRAIYIIMITIVVIDQIVKYIISKELSIYQSISVVDNFFHITYIKNDGAAWSILSGNRIFLILISLLVIWLFYRYFIKNKKLNLTERTTYGILYGGIVGNLLDRLIRGNVIDYLDVRIFGYNFPVFNLADMCIVFSVIMLAVLVLRGEEDANKN